jgi:predicted TIM-barrel fold metal-dependent hydrolase
MDTTRRRWLQAGSAALIGGAASMIPGARVFAENGSSQTRPPNVAFPNSPLNAGKPFGGEDGFDYPPEAYNGPWKNLRAVKQKRVIDIHAHGYTPQQAKGPNASQKEEKRVRASTPWEDVTPQQLKDMDTHGVAKAAVTADWVPLEVYEELKYDKYPDRFIRTAARTKNSMKDMKDVSPQVMAAFLREQFAKGAKMLGEIQTMLGVIGDQYTLKDLGPVVDVLLENDAAVQFHTGWTAAYGNAMNFPYRAPWRWAETMGNFMATYPDVKVILAHSGGSTGAPDGLEALRLLFSFDNAYLDTSKSTPDVVTEAVRGVGAERVLFGTDWVHPGLNTYGPFHFRACYLYWYNLNTVALANITEDQRDWVLYKGAQKLLKLPTA